MALSRGDGATFHAIAMANYLSSRGYKAAVLEMKASGEFSAIQSAYEGMGFSEESDRFTIRRVTYFPYRDDRQDSGILALPFDYIILDCGTPSLAAAANADYPVVVGQGAIWKQLSLDRFLEQYGDRVTPRWALVVSFADADDMKRMKKSWPGETYHAPYVKDPFVIDGETRSQLDGLMGR